MNALVTGGTRGIGSATAALLAESGYEVTVTGRSAKGTPPKGCRYVQADFSNAGDTERLAGEIASWNLSVLINNAGINKIGPLETYSPADFLRIQQVNVTAPFLLCQAVVPSMRKNQYGRILNITSVFGVVSRAQRSAYSTSKFGLFGLTRALALETAGDNVLVNCLAPGFIDTELTRGILGEKGMAEMARSIPQGRLGRPEEIAVCARFLVSPENTYMTGQNVVVDGGFTCV